MSSYGNWKNIIEKFIPYCRAKKDPPVYGLPGWLEDEGTINVIVLRENDENSFNDSIRNNDKLIIFENRPNETFREYNYQVTADPSTNKPGIAHLCEGAYESFVVRPHRWIAGRTALCQDAGEVKIFRTDWLKKIIAFFWGYFGINIHDNGGFWNSSLGCVILSIKAQIIEYKLLLLRAKIAHKLRNKKFTGFIINQSFLKSIGAEV